MAYLGAQFLVFIVLANVASTTEVGRLSWALAFASPLFALADMRTQQVQMTTSETTYSYSDFLGQRIVLIGSCLVLTMPLGWYLTEDAATYRTLIAVMLLKSIEGILNVVIGEHLRRERMGLVALLQLVRSVAYFFPFAACVLHWGRADIGLGAAACALLIPVILGHLTLPKSVRKWSPRSRVMMSLSKDSFPLGIGFFIGSVAVNGPRFILERYHGMEALAIFAAVAYIVVVANTIVDSITQAVMPRMFRYWRSGLHRAIARATLLMIGTVASIGLASVGVAVFMGGFVISLFFGPDYRSGQTMLTILMVAATVQYVVSVVRAVLIAQGLRRGVLLISLCNLLATLLVAFLTVEALGGVGAALSLVAGQLLALILYLIMLRIAFRKSKSNARFSNLENAMMCDQ